MGLRPRRSWATSSGTRSRSCCRSTSSSTWSSTVAGSSPSRSPLTPPEVQAGLSGLEGWTHAEDRLEREFKFGSFREAMSFLIRVAFEAEDMDHHPEINNVYGTVRIGLTTHDAGNKVSAMDLELARRINHLAWI
ncbi:MAG: 4a-hydroxytetrahydrobiopterin dehydratase [Rhodothermales bacterium]|nr:4a-hydroxytetrahydrobiopterin dehydratase [Rhodothermales bacterium]